MNFCFVVLFFVILDVRCFEFKNVALDRPVSWYNNVLLSQLPTVGVATGFKTFKGGTDQSKIKFKRTVAI